MNKTIDNPLISVCIPCYNAASTIVETLTGVIHQSYSNLEIIICDNCSTDQTVSLIQQIQDPRIQLYINETNLGMVGNFERVLSKATGTYVKVMCSDDLISLDCIEKQLQPFLDFPEQNIAMVTCEKLIINQNGKTIFQKRYPGKKGIHNGIKVIRKVLSSGSNLIGEPGTVLFNHQIALKTSGYQIEKELSYVVDLNFWIKMLLIGDLYVIKEPLFSFRVSKTSASASYGSEQARTFNRLIDKYVQLGAFKMCPLKIWKGKLFSHILSFVRNLIFKFAN